jgi:site-specific recombinase XerD
MLEQLFSRSLPRYTASPHAADLDAFATMAAACGHTGRIPERHTRRLQSVLARAVLPPNATISIDALRAAFAPWPRKGYVGTFRLFVRYLGDRGRLDPRAPCEPRFAVKDQHLRRLVELRGIAPATVIYDNWALTDFLSRVLEPDATPASLTRHKIDEFFRQRGPQLARRTFRHTVQVVRRYLRYAFETGALSQPLHEFELPKAFAFERPPRALSPQLVQRLLASIDRQTRTGRRDHAMLHIMAGYGLRPGEVASLKHSSIDWAASTLRVEQSKTRSILILPLASQTIALLREYINACDPHDVNGVLFGVVNAPLGPMSARGLGPLQGACTTQRSADR